MHICILNINHANKATITTTTKSFKKLIVFLFIIPPYYLNLYTYLLFLIVYSNSIDDEFETSVGIFIYKYFP